MVKQTFISYSHKDGSDFANQLYNDLKFQGINPWLDTREIKPSQNWNRTIDEALRQTDAVLVVLTPEGVISDQVESEWNYAKEKGKQIIPLLVKDCEIPRVLFMIQYIDFRADYKAKLEHLLERLVMLESLEPQKQDKPSTDIDKTQQALNRQPPIRVLIVDDHHMVRKGLITLLDNFNEFEVVADASDGQAGVTLAQHYKPDVVLMDIVMPGMDGVEATRLIRESCPDTQIIALTSFSDDETIKNALKSGAISFLMKNVSVDELAQAVRNAHQGKPTLASEAVHALINVARQ